MNQPSVEAKIEALSDAFESTFTRYPDGTLANLFHEREKPLVETLVKKFLGATEVTFQKAPGFEKDSYALWLVRFK